MTVTVNLWIYLGTGLLVFVAGMIFGVWLTEWARREAAKDKEVIENARNGE